MLFRSAMDLEDAKELSALKRDEKAAKAKEEEMQEWAMIIGGTFFILFLLFVGVNEIMDMCKGARCGR